MLLVPHCVHRLDSVQCSGAEEGLAACAHPGWGEHDCNHVRDAGAVCSVHEGDVRLADGESELTGRVEIFHDGE